MQKIGLLKFENKIVCSFLDRFIIRSFSPVTTIGGGKIFDINISGKWSDKKIYMMNLLSKTKKSDIIHEIVNYRKKNPITVIFITHVLKEAILLGDRILFFSKKPGTVVFDYKVKSVRKPLTLDNKSVDTEYKKLKSKYPQLLQGLV